MAVPWFDGHVDARCLGVLRGVRQRLRDDVVAATSIDSATSSGSRTSRTTGTGERRARVLSAGARPPCERATGCRPEAIVRPGASSHGERGAPAGRGSQAQSGAVRTGRERQRYLATLISGLDSFGPSVVS